MICLPKFITEKFLKSLPEDISKLTDMTSEQRRAFFTEVAGPKAATEINALFESKLLLKNQQLGLINWAQKVAGLKPEVKRDFLTRVRNMEKFLEPEEAALFLEDIVEKRLGFGVSVEEAGRIADLSKQVETKKLAMSEDAPIRSQERLEYGAALDQFKEYVGTLKEDAKKVTLKDAKERPVEAIYKTTLGISGNAKALLSTLDNSFFLRQGLRVMFSNPTVWAKNIVKSFGDIAKELKGVDAQRLMKADIYSRPNAINGKYEKMDLAVGIKGEEAFPPSLFARIHAVGRLFKGFESAYNGAALRMRADLADILIKRAEENGLNMKDATEAKSVGRLINSMTGRGYLGRLEPVADVLNQAFFSPRYIKSQWDAITGYQLTMKITPFARRVALENFGKTLAGLGGLLTLANTIQPESVTFDPRSTNFGKIIINGISYDVTGGIPGIGRLLAQTFPTEHNGKRGFWKQTAKGRWVHLDSGKFGQDDAVDNILNFVEGKASPAMSVGLDVIRQKDFDGKKPTAQSIAKNLTVPLPAMTFNDLMKSEATEGEKIVANMLSFLGIGINVR